MFSPSELVKLINCEISVFCRLCLSSMDSACWRSVGSCDCMYSRSVFSINSSSYKIIQKKNNSQTSISLKRTMTCMIAYTKIKKKRKVYLFLLYFSCFFPKYKYRYKFSKMIPPYLANILEEFDSHLDEDLIFIHASLESLMNSNQFIHNLFFLTASVSLERKELGSF